MKKYILSRLLHMIPVLLAVSFVSMFIIDLAPGDFLSTLRADPQISQSAVERMRAEFALDRPWFVQYLHWLKNVVTRFDLGQSFSYKAPVSGLVLGRLGNTLLLTGTAYAFAWLLAVPMGALAAARRNSWIDRASSLAAVVGLSVPQVLLVLLTLYFCVVTGLLPAGGMKSAATYDLMSPWGRVADVLRHLIAPAAVLSVVALAGIARQMRSNMLEFLDADFVRTARAKGLGEGRVIFKHVFRNALNPLITMFGFTIGGLLGGSLIVEYVMGWPGLGALTLEAVRRQDLYVVLAGLVMSSAMLVLGNLVADIMLKINDPRISYER
jgi:peptide/nickel transport system permease protein